MKKSICLIVLMGVSFLSIGNDTLQIKSRFSFYKKSSKYFQEPKFIEIDIINTSKNDYYFLVPFFYTTHNKKDTIPVSFLKGRYENDLDITYSRHPKQVELKTFRNEVRKRLKEGNVNLDSETYFSYWKEESDEFYSNLGFILFIKKNSKITLSNLISNNLDKGEYSMIMKTREFNDPVYKFFPEKFKCYKFFKGEFIQKNYLEFVVE